ncbi:unnamed protein product [Brassica napus]|uniref:Uncharacterized protein n=3 Tax=Brassica TaxID=3705 RepID=A0A0D3E8M7_BRAOL|nr:unnamed protein product [Brassica napus]VDD31288.1 unnamed protein product [Brassica oleracea]
MGLNHNCAIKIEHSERVHVIAVTKPNCTANCQECVFFWKVN